MITGDIQYVADDLVYVFEHHAGAHGLGLFQNAQEHTQPAGRNVFQICAVQNYLFSLAVKQRLKGLGGLLGGSSVQFAGKDGYESFVGFLNGGSHCMDLVIVNTFLSPFRQ